MLDLSNPSDSPFLHNRQKTFQPRDLWEWLLRLAIVLFPIDVGLRRIQLDPEELRRARQWLLRWLLFWKPVPRPAQAEESLAALLARREQVRSTQTAPALQPSPDLFRPANPEASPLVAPAPATRMTEQPATASTPQDDQVGKPPDRTTTTSRLLEAKRRAQRRP
jgi:hypothetical protein